MFPTTPEVILGASQAVLKAQGPPAPVALLSLADTWADCPKLKAAPEQGETTPNPAP